MKHSLKALISLFIIVVAVSSCGHGQGKHIPSKECIDLNNRAVDFLVKYPVNLDKAIELAKEATHCDSNYILPYFSLVNAYSQKHAYDDAIIAVNKILTRAKNAPALLIQKAMLFERKNNIDSANRLYSAANIECKKRLSKNP